MRAERRAPGSGLIWNWKFHAPDPITRANAIERIAALEPIIRGLGVQQLALFGSVARDEARIDSDVDILVQFCPGAKNYDRFLALAELLETHLGQRVELVTIESLSPFRSRPHDYLRHMTEEAEYLIAECRDLNVQAWRQSGRG